MPLMTKQVEKRKKKRKKERKEGRKEEERGEKRNWKEAEVGKTKGPGLYRPLPLEKNREREKGVAPRVNMSSTVPPIN